MQLPYHLRRRSQGEAATALLLPSEDAAALLELCARLNHDPLPDLFLTADGILLLLEEPTVRSYPPAVRLRQLSEFLLLPADADLAPQLHADEAAGLTRDRGLVFLPGGRVLEFEPDAPLDLGALLSVGRVHRDSWGPLPRSRPLAEQIRSIVLDVPHDDPEDVVEAGGQGIGEEDPRPEGAGVAETAANRARMSLGRMLSRLGQALGADALRRAGERMIDRATAAVPRLGESLHGMQGAALRDLLRMFQSGDLERALRRAIPKGEEPSHRGRVNTGAALPTHDLRYSLRNLLGGSSGGPANVWTGHDDVVQQLFREYRKAAEAAANNGDFRRAAYIYGKLLAEWRQAADVLARGGLHHDAAILYRDKLTDPLKAAEQFELAGEFDEALRIYDRRQEHERAGDLLRRMGEEDAAIARFLKAAEVMMQTGRGPLRAGEFVLKKTNRGELAEVYFAAGWCMRSVSTLLGDAVPCALHLARMLAQREKPDEFLTLLGETESFFAVPGNAVAAGQMFNELARVSAGPLFDSSRDEVRDRCLLALASKLREHAGSEERPGTIVSTLLGATGVWEPAAVRDASVALKAALKEPQRAERSELPTTILHLGSGTITAARVAPHTGEVFAGFDSGLLMAFRAASNRLATVGRCQGPITALATTLSGDLVVAACIVNGAVLLQSFLRHRDGEFSSGGALTLPGTRETGLAPLIVSLRGEPFTLVRHGPAPLDLSAFRGDDFISVHSGPYDESDDWPLDLPLPKELPGKPGVAFLVLQKGEASLCVIGDSPAKRERVAACPVDWTPHLPAGSTLSKPPATWHQYTADCLEVAGLNEENAIYWVDLRIGGNSCRVERLLATGCREGYRAVKLIRPGVMAGVTAKNRLIWLRAGGDRLTEWAPPASLTSSSPAVAAFFSQPSQELIVLLANGSLVRVPVPS